MHPADKPRKLRMARHFYDLCRLLRAGVGEGTMADKSLFARLAEHREIFFSYSWLDYSTHKPSTFRLFPPADHLPNWQADYHAMLGPMFFGETPPFDEILIVVSDLEKKFSAQ